MKKILLMFFLLSFLSGNAYAKKMYIDAASGEPGGQVSVSVKIDEASSIAGFDLELVYDSEILQIVSATAGSDFSGLNPNVNIDIEGRVIVSAGATVGINEGFDLEVLGIVFNIKDGSYRDAKVVFDEEFSDIYSVEEVIGCTFEGTSVSLTGINFQISFSPSVPEEIVVKGQTSFSVDFMANDADVPFTGQDDFDIIVEGHGKILSKNIVGGDVSVTYEAGETVGEDSIIFVEKLTGKDNQLSTTILSKADIPSVLSIVSGNNQNGTVGTTLTVPLMVRVEDSYANSVPNAVVGFLTLNGNGSADPATTTSDSNGTAYTTYTLGTKAETVLVNATVDGIDPIQFRLTAEPGDLAAFVVEAPDSAAANVTQQIAITAKDENGNVINDFSGDIEILVGGQTLNRSFAGTENGTLVTSVNWPTQAGDSSIVVSAGEVQSNVEAIKIQHADAVRLDLVVDKTVLSSNGAGSATAVATVLDAYGNIVTDYAEAVEFSLSDDRYLVLGNATDMVNGTLEVSLVTRSGAVDDNYLPYNSTLSVTSGNLSGDSELMEVVNYELRVTLDPHSGSVVAGNATTVFVSVLNNGDAILLDSSDVIGVSLESGSGALGAKTLATNGTVVFFDYTTNSTVEEAILLVNENATEAALEREISVLSRAGAPAFFEAVSGSGQQAEVNSTITAPLVVQVRDSNANPVPDVTVLFDLVQGNGTLGNATVETDANGTASTTFTFGIASGTFLVNATQGDLPPVQFSLTALPDEFDHFDLAAYKTAVANATRTVTVTARDQYGNPVPGYTGEVSLKIDGDSVASHTFAAEDQGTYAFEVTVSKTVGEYTLSVSDASGEHSLDQQFDVEPAAAAQLVLETVESEMPSNGKGEIAVVAKVQDAFGNAVNATGLDVSFALGDETYTDLSNGTVSTIAGAAGVNVSSKSGLVAVDDLPYTVTVTASADGLSSDSVDLQIVNYTLECTVDEPVVAGANATITVQLLKDSEENYGFGGAHYLNASLAQGNGTLGVPVAGDNGTLKVVYQTNGTVETSIIDFSEIWSPGGATAQVTITTVAGEPDTLKIDTGDGQSGPVGTALANSLKVLVVDAFGNAVSNASVEFVTVSGNGAATPGTASSDENGTAAVSYTLGTVAGTDLVNATVEGVAPVQFSLAAEPGDLASFDVDAPSSADANATQQVSITAKDEYGNVITDFSGEIEILVGGQTLSRSFNGTENGILETSINWPTQAGSASIAVSSGSVETAPEEIVVEPAAPASIALDADKMVLSSNSLSNATAVATVLDAYGNTVTDFDQDIEFILSDDTYLVLGDPAGSVTAVNGTATVVVGTKAGTVDSADLPYNATLSAVYDILEVGSVRFSVVNYALSVALSPVSGSIAAGGSTTVSVSVLNNGQAEPLSGIDDISVTPKAGNGTIGEKSLSEDGTVVTFDYTTNVKVEEASLSIREWVTDAALEDTIAVVSVPGSPVTLELVSGNSQQATVDTPLAENLVVRVADENDNPISGVGVEFDVIEGNGTLSAASVETGADGSAETGFTLGTTAGNYAVNAAVDGLASVRFDLTGVPGDLAAFDVDAPSSAAANESLQIAVTAMDEFGNVITDFVGDVDLVIGGTTVNKGFTGNENGILLIPVNWPVSAGGSSISVSSGQVSTGTINVTVEPAAPAKLVLKSSLATIPLPTDKTVIFTASVLDVYGNDVPGAYDDIDYTFDPVLADENWTKTENGWRFDPVDNLVENRTRVTVSAGINSLSDEAKVLVIPMKDFTVKVVDEDGTAVRGVEVRLKNSSNSTDENGLAGFLIPDTGGKVLVEVPVPGTAYFPRTQAFDASKDEVIFSLESKGELKIIGSVLDGNDAPVENATVIAYHFERAGTYFESTNATGQFEIFLPEDAPEQGWLVKASALWYSEANATCEEWTYDNGTVCVLDDINIVKMPVVTFLEEDLGNDRVTIPFSVSDNGTLDDVHLISGKGVISLGNGEIWYDGDDSFTFAVDVSDAMNTAYPKAQIYGYQVGGGAATFDVIGIKGNEITAGNSTVSVEEGGLRVQASFEIRETPTNSTAVSGSLTIVEINAFAGGEQLKNDDRIDQIVITIPFDPFVVEAEDLKSGSYVIYYADSASELEAGNGTPVPAEDILEIYYSGNVGYVIFRVDHLTAFGIGAASSSSSGSSSDGGGGCVLNPNAGFDASWLLLLLLAVVGKGLVVLRRHG